jgi:hypothetical protein
MKRTHPHPQSAENRFVNEMLRALPANKDQFVWAVYNSGDPIWKDNPNAIELVLFATKETALGFVRDVLKNNFGFANIDKLSDESVEHLMWDADSDRYLHLYELKVHPDNHWTISAVF